MHPITRTAGASILLGLLAALLALYAPRAAPAFMMASPPVSGSVPWADQPMELVATPVFATNKTDLFATGASHMALLHNAIIRGYNSIYLQAPRVADADKADFVGYALTWFKFVKSHHDDEELALFPKVEALLAAGVLAETYTEHETFMDGLGEFAAYLTATLPTPQAFHGPTLVRIMDGFHAAFAQHFHHEIATLAALAAHPGAPAAGSDRAAEAAGLFKAWGKATVAKAGTWDVVPFFLLHLDRTAGFEDGVWAGWPPMPAPVRWGLVNVAGWWYGGYWRFASCDAAGQRRELYALR